MTLAAAMMNFSGARPAPPASTGSTPDDRERISRLKKACQDMETLFMHTLIKSMREAGPKGGLFSGTTGSEIYDSLADEQFAVHLSQAGGMGLGQLVFNQVARRENMDGAADDTAGEEGLDEPRAAAPALLQPAEARQADQGEVRRRSEEQEPTRIVTRTPKAQSFEQRKKGLTR